AWVLEKTGNNQTNAARLLGINRNTLHRKLAQYNML
ncbi:MAG: helix-turn-helix domain-containing protein, partial [Rhodocyclaceae bacterium]|nr:helix-turn-helix domain-containing protein [Rhodocyclaceae bacterium]